MNKKLTRCKLCGDIHFGLLAPLECDSCGAKGSYKSITKEEANTAVQTPGYKKFWRCNVCNDTHWGKTYPKNCPTCKFDEAYCEIEKKEFLKFIEVFLK